MNKAIRQRSYDLSTQSSRGDLRRFVVSLLGLFVLTFNIVGAGAMPARADEAGNAPFAQALLDDRIVICTATGMVVMDRDGNIIDAGSAGTHDNLCVFCLPLMHGGAKAPTAQVLVLQLEPVFLGEFSRRTPPAAKTVRLSGAAAPRAPPIA
jgi:hypothetical protein